MRPKRHGPVECITNTVQSMQEKEDEVFTELQTMEESILQWMKEAFAVSVIQSMLAFSCVFLVLVVFVSLSVVDHGDRYCQERNRRD